MPSSRHRPPSRRPHRSSFELLEARRVFDAAGGVLAGADLHLTLSFAPDGTFITAQTSGLAAKLNALGPASAWQETILRAFQTWAKETNADVGVVLDGGQAFGVGGATQRDSRFGDIRIGAVAMEPNVGAVNVPTDTPVGGTWFADVIFNTAFNFTSLDDLYAVALNEAGNVFGLKDHRGPTADPDSPLTPSNPPVVHSPTAADLADLHALLGTRSPDANEKSVIGGTTTPDNDSFANATPLKRGEAYTGYYSVPFQEIVAIYNGLWDGKSPGKH